MARFWKRDDDLVGRVLRTHRPEPREDFVQSILGRLEGAKPSRRVSAGRFRLALVMSVLLVALAAALGGISAASAGVGGIFHVASKVVSPAKTDSSSSGTQNVANNDTKGDKGKGADDKGRADEDQYKVGICHRTDHHPPHYHLIFVGPAAVAAHLRHGDHFPVDGRC
jgi:hypothetical protein